MLDLVGYLPENDLSKVSVLEPSWWDGVFVMECLRRLLASSRIHGFNFEEAVLKNLLIVEIDAEKISQLIGNVRDFLDSERMTIREFESKIIICGDFLLADIKRSFDIVIWNPPYIRYDNIPSGIRAEYKLMFGTFKNRCDIYVPFYEKSLSHMNAGWKLCFICSNRWIKSAYGKELRGLIAKSYAVEKIVNLEKVNVFAEEVIAYPAITVIWTDSASFPTFQYVDIEKQSDILRLFGNEGLSQDEYLNLNQPKDSNWDFRKKHRSTKMATLESLWFRIWIGVATWADKVFVGKNLFAEVESDVLLPIVSWKDLRTGKIVWQWNYLINPYDKDGTLVDLSAYPRLEAYLGRNEKTLRNRHVAKKNEASWYRTIDKVKPAILKTVKLLLPDTSSNSFIQMEHGDFYPHHNLAYITHENTNYLKILWAFLSSDFCRQQMREIWNLMNWGFIRWQIQSLKKLNIPNFSDLSETLQLELIDAYDAKDGIKIENIVKLIVQGLT